MPDRPGDMDERDVDARFASIVARWDGPVPDVDQAPPTTSPSAPEARARVPPTAVAGRTHRADDATEPDAAEPAAPPVAPRAPWVNPSPLEVVVPPPAWRAAEPTTRRPRKRPPPPPRQRRTRRCAETTSTSSRPRSCSPRRRTCSFWGAVIGLVAGPLMLLWVVFARPSHSTRWFVVSVVVSLVGFGLLILRQPTHRDPTSGDNGARV